MRQGSTGTSGGVAGASYVVTAAATPADCSPTACSVTFDNANGDTPTGNLDAQHMVTIAKGNSLKIEIADHKYTVTGTNSRIPGWSYAFDSTTGAGTWKQNNTTNFEKAGSCLVSLDSTRTRLIIGRDGMTCKLSTALVDSAVTDVRNKITEVDLHGHIVIVDGSKLFYLMKSLTNIPYLDGQTVVAAPNTSYSSMFSGDTSLATADSLSHWDTSNVADMSGMFKDAYVFDQPVPFDTRNVKDMSDMFNYAYAFNHPVSSFDTSNVKDMSEMFYGAHAFDQDLSNFDTRRVENMKYMFNSAYAFNHSVSSFITSNVGNGNDGNMDSMFYGAHAFNKSVSSFDTSHLISMKSMFNSAYAFDQDVSNFDTSKVTNMDGMFQNAYAFNHSVSNFNTSNVTNMRNMFNGARAFDQDLTGWNVGNVNDHYTFNDGSALTADHLPHF
jgi:surface protein